VRLRVIPEQHGEPPFEATAMTRVHTLKYLGGTVPVWYDPENTARVVVDYEADLATEMHWMADAERLAHRPDQRLGLVWTPLGGDLLRVAVKGRLDKLVGGHAAAAMECGALAGELDGALAELRRVRCRHGDILPDGRGHLRSGVRETGASSVGVRGASTSGRCRDHGAARS
jgi:hypothetical protein